MSQFDIDVEKIKHIAREFGVDEAVTSSIYSIFSTAVAGVKYQYLAHVIRTMEQYIRKTTGNPMFQINCYPITLDSPVIKVGCAQYYPGKLFSIFFDSRMDDKQLRVCLAHELGHLFIIEWVNERKAAGESPHTSETMTEPLSSIFGVFTIMDKNRFYEECCQRLNHKSWEDIVKDFIFLQNRLENP